MDKTEELRIKSLVNKYGYIIIDNKIYVDEEHFPVYHRIEDKHMTAISKIYDSIDDVKHCMTAHPISSTHMYAANYIEENGKIVKCRI